MSVKHNGGSQKKSSDSHFLSEKKRKKLFQQGKSKNWTKEKLNSVNTSPAKRHFKSNVDNVNKTKICVQTGIDKHTKRQEKKKLQRLKVFEQKKSDIVNKKTTLCEDKVVKTLEGKNSFRDMEKKKYIKKQRRKKMLNDKSKPAASQENMEDKKENITSSTSSPTIDVSGKKKLKCLKWKQKQMAKKLARKGLTNTQEHKQVKTITEKVELPKTADEATANWKKLQETVLSKKGEKRKIPDQRIRNPKLRKVEDLKDEKEAMEKDNQIEKESEIWFDDVDEMLLDRKPVSIKATAKEDGNNGTVEETNPLVKLGAFKGVTKIVCMDCEMVGVGDGSDNMLARVSIVNQYGEPVYDKFVKPKEKVIDYRTFVSGVRPQDLEDADEFEQVQKDVAEILKGRILVGHAIKNDLKVLYLSHPKKNIRDTSLYKPFRQLSGGRTPALKKLSEKILAVKVQEGEHNSVQDAQATMRLYTMYRKQWESDLKKQKREKRKKKGKT